MIDKRYDYELPNENKWFYSISFAKNHDNEFQGEGQDTPKLAFAEALELCKENKYTKIEIAKIEIAIAKLEKIDLRDMVFPDIIFDSMQDAAWDNWQIENWYPDDEKLEEDMVIAVIEVLRKYNKLPHWGQFVDIQIMKQSGDKI